MAAKNSQTFTFNASIENICWILKDPRLYVELKFRFNSEMGGYNSWNLYFSYGVSMSSWGEDITVSLVALNPQTTSVTILSECSLPTQLVDWGKNKGNVNSLFDYINRNLAYATAPQGNYAPPAYGVGFCSNCGAQVQPNAIFCSACGARIQ